MNHLATERSPYLLQHANNPVDWFAWGDEAFGKAREENKPIFLSVGYSTCHWCHVMERESFENDTLASILNEHFVSIKVDREERPDVDRVYMTFVQATTGSGGWPMSVWLTPDLRPFYGGTYFPPSQKWGRPGFAEILQEIARVWRAEQGKVEQSAGNVIERLRTLERTKPVWTVPDTTALTRTVRQFREAFDARFGGFGEAPKFPRPSELLFLMREHARTGDPDAREMALRTLRAMALGGMRDHVGGGFHRYAVDGQWRVPHFEKMLYDQAQLVFAYAEASQLSNERPAPQAPDPGSLGVGPQAVTMKRPAPQAPDPGSLGVGPQAVTMKRPAPQAPDPGSLGVGPQAVIEDVSYAEIAEDTLRYVLREMTEAHGGFYSAEDADSVPPESSETAPVAGAHKMEGAFYLWRDDEIDAIVGEDDARVVKRRFGIEPQGNAPHDPQQEFVGKNLLYIAQSIDEIAQATGKSSSEVADILNRARVRLFEERLNRPRPDRDEKVLAAWNGLMIAALAKMARVLGGRVEFAGRSSVYLEAARRAATFVREHMWNAVSMILSRRYREGHAEIDGFAEDYAFLIFGLLELFQADPDPAWLEWAVVLQRRLDELFWDEEEGGWFSTTGKDPSVLLRMKDEHDGAEPTASSVSVLNLLTLTHLVQEPTWVDRIERTLRLFGSRLDQMGRAVPMMAAALSTYVAGPQQIVLTEGSPGDTTDALARALAGHYLPFAIMLRVSAESRRALETILPAVAAMEPVGGASAVFVCRDFVCRRPVTTVAEVNDQLNEAAAEPPTRAPGGGAPGSN